MGKIYGFDGDRNLADGCRTDLRIMVSFFIRQRGLDGEEVEDCTQECLLRLWRHFGSIMSLAQAMKEKRNWILVCTKHHVSNYCRAQRLRIDCEDKMPIPIDWIDPEQSHTAVMLRHELRERIEICLRMLPPEQYALVIRHYQHGETAAEIAATLGTSTNAVEQRWLRSRRKLYKLFLENGISETEVTDYWGAMASRHTIFVIR